MRLASGGGLLAYILIGYVFSKHRRHVQWSQVLRGFYLQFLFGLLIIRWQFGRQLFQCLGDKTITFLDFTDAGSEFVFGYLVTGSLQGNVTFNNGTTDLLTSTLPVQASLFAFKVMPVVIFISFFVSILYYYGIMQVMIVKAGWLLQWTIGVTACESMYAWATIFVGMSEAPIVIRPYLPVLTKSEFHTIMTCSYATIAGSVMAAYINFGISAKYLLSASLMSAPAGLAFSKLIYPETEQSRTTTTTDGNTITIENSTESSPLEAGSNGASLGVKLIAFILANLIAILAFIRFLDTIISWFGSLVDYPELSFKFILSKLFIPLALMMGIEWHECDRVAKLIGLKTVINEFVAYQELSVMIKTGDISKRAQTVATYALCGFSNFGSIGIMLATLTALAPDRKSDLAPLALRAMIAGSIVCFMNACIAGLLTSSI